MTAAEAFFRKGTLQNETVSRRRGRRGSSFPKTILTSPLPRAFKREKELGGAFPLTSSEETRQRREARAPWILSRHLLPPHQVPPPPPSSPAWRFPFLRPSLFSIFPRFSLFFTTCSCHTTSVTYLSPSPPFACHPIRRWSSEGRRSPPLVRIPIFSFPSVRLNRHQSDIVFFAEAAAPPFCGEILFP